jgi:hypothetical protein
MCQNHRFCCYLPDKARRITGTSRLSVTCYKISSANLPLSPLSTLILRIPNCGIPIAFPCDWEITNWKALANLGTTRLYKHRSTSWTGNGTATSAVIGNQITGRERRYRVASITIHSPLCFQCTAFPPKVCAIHLSRDHMDSRLSEHLDTRLNSDEVHGGSDCQTGWEN